MGTTISGTSGTSGTGGTTGTGGSVRDCALAMVSPGRGILAADESPSTMSKRLDAAGVAPTEENRRAYREMLVTTPGLSRAVSGVILCEETFGQRCRDGLTFPEALTAAGMLPGIKVDTGAHPLAGTRGETVTEGLDGLRARLADFYARGARFAKWRAVIRIGADLPSPLALRANSHALARYAALCQEAGIVPIVEPEVLMEGDHAASRCAAVTSAVLLDTMAELLDFGVDPAGVVLKPNMVLPGSGSGERATPQETAAATVRTLLAVVPEQVAGVAFLSGGQDAAEATANLAALQELETPWPLTFSFGRALVDPALAAWAEDVTQVRAGQLALAHRVACNAAALEGSYDPVLERRSALV